MSARRAIAWTGALGLIACTSGIVGRAPSPTPTDAPFPSDSPSPIPVGGLDVPLAVKEVAGVGSDGFPVSAVVPLPYGRYPDLSKLRVVDGAGAEVPAQLSVLDRHWAKDGSVRHAFVTLMPTVAAFTGPGTGVTTLHLRDDAAPKAPRVAVQLTDTAAAIAIDTGALVLRVEKSPLRIVTPAGAIDPVFLDQSGQPQRSFDRSDVRIEIEERGPLMAQLRISAPTLHAAGGRTKHGWALRLWAYAGKSYLKLDYQLQNSAKNETIPPPLFFKGLSLELATGQATTARTQRTSVPDAEPSTLALGALDAGPVQAMIRHFHPLWPNGLAVDATGKLSVELWPSWSAQDFGGQLSPANLYWLNDMQQVVKEVLFHFGPLGAAELSALSKTFELHPVVTLPVSWWADTGVTLDLGGVLPLREKLSRTDARTPPYARYSNGAEMVTPWRAKLGWNAFGADLSRRDHPNTTGGWPPSVSRFFASEDPADYWFAEDFAMAELNVMPEWLSEYSYQADFARLKLTENPYGSYSWRTFDANYGYNPAPGYSAVPGSGQIAKPRDDQHGWFYHVGEAYYVSGNPWIRDWYRFVAEFRRTRLNQKDPFPDMSGRATGHALNHAIQAYRITGDREILSLIHQYAVSHLVPDVDPVLGGRRSFMSGGELQKSEAVFQLGYLARALIDYLEEIPDQDEAVMNLVGGFVRWNVRNANFGYYQEVDAVNLKSDGSGLIFCDPQAWWVLKTQDRAAYDHLQSYVSSGLGGGARPYGNVAQWSGDFNGRLVTKVLSRGPP